VQCSHVLLDPVQFGPCSNQGRLELALLGFPVGPFLGQGFSLGADGPAGLLETFHLVGQCFLAARQFFPQTLYFRRPAVDFLPGRGLLRFELLALLFDFGALPSHRRLGFFLAADVFLLGPLPGRQLLGAAPQLFLQGRQGLLGLRQGCLALTQGLPFRGNPFQLLLEPIGSAAQQASLLGMVCGSALQALFPLSYLRLLGGQ
jgi:hypothetical protein